MTGGCDQSNQQQLCDEEDGAFELLLTEHPINRPVAQRDAPACALPAWCASMSLLSCYAENRGPLRREVQEVVGRWRKRPLSPSLTT